MLALDSLPVTSDQQITASAVGSVLRLRLQAYGISFRVFTKFLQPLEISSRGGGSTRCQIFRIRRLEPASES